MAVRHVAVGHPSEFRHCFLSPFFGLSVSLKLIHELFFPQFSVPSLLLLYRALDLFCLFFSQLSSRSLVYPSFFLTFFFFYEDRLSRRLSEGERFLEELSDGVADGSGIVGSLIGDAIEVRLNV